ncbi:MAG: DUF2917 domain-containing protein [Deltaproteobacteria bacterium]|nr:DUF2917 domain-containing protein [Deltaproteobacteria bacterium]
MLEIRIPKKNIVNVDGPMAGVEIACESGDAWITQCCDSRDYMLTSGMVFAARRDGRITVQIIKDGIISIRLRSRATGELRRRLSWKRLRCRLSTLIPKGR